MSTVEPVSVYEKAIEMARAAGDLEKIGYLDNLWGDFARLINPYPQQATELNVLIQLALIATIFFSPTIIILFFIAPEMKKTHAIFTAGTTASLIIMTVLAIFALGKSYFFITEERSQARENYYVQATEEIHKSFLDHNGYDTQSLEPEVEDISWDKINYHRDKP